MRLLLLELLLKQEVQPIKTTDELKEVLGNTT
jgi:hypothetical protein